MDTLNAGTNVTAYCVKCRAKVSMQNPQWVTLKNGQPARKGTCADCNMTILRMGRPATT